MAHEFIKWTGRYGHSGIYRDDKTGKLSSTASDMHGIEFDTVEDIEAWINDVYYGDQNELFDM